MKHDYHVARIRINKVYRHVTCRILTTEVSFEQLLRLRSKLATGRFLFGISAVVGSTFSV